MARTILKKELEKTRLANNYGGWIYCDECNKNIGYLCYVTYDMFKFEYTCKCGSHGKALIEMEETPKESCNKDLITIKNRLCCPEDESPLVTIMDKNLESYKFEVVCDKCKKTFASSFNN